MFVFYCSSVFKIAFCFVKWRLFSKELNKETVQLLERNQGCLSILIEGDIIEYVANEDDFDNPDNSSFWAIYMGNSMIMRLDQVKKQIVYESYWKIANENYIFINKELDKKLTTLPIYETLYRARNANTNKKMVKKFSSGRNFAMWCRFDINRSDIDLATNSDQYNSTQAKFWLIDKFIESLDMAKELQPKSDKKKKRDVKTKSSVVVTDKAWDYWICIDFNWKHKTSKITQKKFWSLVNEKKNE